jgi:hypothetical protein
MITFADNFIVVYDNCTHHWIGAGETFTFASELKTTAYVDII